MLLGSTTIRLRTFHFVYDTSSTDISSTLQTFRLLLYTNVSANHYFHQFQLFLIGIYFVVIYFVLIYFVLCCPDIFCLNIFCPDIFFLICFVQYILSWNGLASTLLQSCLLSPLCLVFILLHLPSICFYILFKSSFCLPSNLRLSCFCLRFVYLLSCF